MTYILRIDSNVMCENISTFSLYKQDLIIRIYSIRSRLCSRLLRLKLTTYKLLKCVLTVRKFKYV